MQKNKASTQSWKGEKAYFISNKKLLVPFMLGYSLEIDRRNEKEKHQQHKVVS